MAQLEKHLQEKIDDLEDRLTSRNDRIDHLTELVSRAVQVFSLQAIRDSADKPTHDGWLKLVDEFRNALRNY